jgi:hypothetical protein
MAIIKKKTWPEIFVLITFGQKDLIEKHGLYVIQLED